MEEGDKKYNTVLAKLTAAEEMKVVMAELKGRSEVMADRIRQLEGEARELTKEREKAND